MPHHRRFSRTILRERRRSVGLSLDDLALCVFRSPYTTREWERGRVVPPTDTLPLLAAALRCSIDDLFEDVAAKTATGTL